MRGRNEAQSLMLAFVDLEERVPHDHPLRSIKRLADQILAELSPVFDPMYAELGRPSIPPERLLKASLLIALYSVRSERAFCEELDYNLMFRWFLDMNLMEPSFVPTSFTKNRGRLLEHAVGQRFLERTVGVAKERGYLSDEHFTIDGTLIEAWASLKSFRPRDGARDEQPPDDPGNPTVDFHGERRSNATHQSTTDPEARLAKKGGTAARLSYLGHALMENRNGLLVDFQITAATGTAERDVVGPLLDRAQERGFHPTTLGADKGYDTRDCVADLAARAVSPHIARNITRHRGSAVDDPIAATPDYAVSQRLRKRVEEIFGWMKTVGGLRRTRYRGLELTQLAGYLVAAAYNLVRMARLEVKPATS
jgi:transposase